MKRSVVTGAVLLGIAVLYWYLADGIPKSPMSGSVGADGLPKLLAICLGVLSLILIAQSVLSPASEPAAAAADVEDTGDAEFTGEGFFLALKMLTIAVVYVLILPVLGYAASAGLLLLAIAMFFGRPFGFQVLAFASVGAVMAHLVFVTLLGVRMPTGFWPSLGWF